MPTYDFVCSVCSEPEIIQAPYEARDMQLCTICGSPTVRQLSAPHSTKASYVDGVRRKGWADMREASALNKEAAGSSSNETKAAISKEIRNKLKVDIQR